MDLAFNERVSISTQIGALARSVTNVCPNMRWVCVVRPIAGNIPLGVHALPEKR